MMVYLIKQLVVFASALAMITVAGCGHKGKDDGNNDSGANKAVLVFGTSLPTGSSEKIGTVQLSFELPAGVTVPTDSSGAVPNGPNGVLNISGEALRFAAQPNAVIPTLMGKYTPATSTSNATVTIGFIVVPNNGLGVMPGEFATLICDLAPEAKAELAAFKSMTSVLIGNTAGVKLFDSLGGITGPASATYKVTLPYESRTGITGSYSTSAVFKSGLQVN
jgi:hypothetical protein